MDRSLTMSSDTSSHGINGEKAIPVEAAAAATAAMWRSLVFTAVNSGDDVGDTCGITKGSLTSLDKGRNVFML